MNQPRRIFLNEMTQGVCMTLQATDGIGSKESLRISSAHNDGHISVVLKNPEWIGGWLGNPSGTALNDFDPYLPHIMAATDTGIITRSDCVSQDIRLMAETPVYVVRHGCVEAMQVAFTKLLASMENRLALEMYRQVQRCLKRGADVTAIQPPWLTVYDDLHGSLEFDAKLVVFGLSREDAERGHIKRYDPVVEQAELNKHLYKEFSLYCPELNKARDLMYNKRESESSSKKKRKKR